VLFYSSPRLRRRLRAAVLQAPALPDTRARHTLQVTVIGVSLRYATVQIQRASTNSAAAAEPALLALTRTRETADAKP